MFNTREVLTFDKGAVLVDIAKNNADYSDEKVIYDYCPVCLKVAEHKHDKTTKGLLNIKYACGHKTTTNLATGNTYYHEDGQLIALN